MKKLLLAICIVGFAVCTAFADNVAYEADRKLFGEVCGKCHQTEWFLWPRSFKSWELTVANMRSYADDSGDSTSTFTSEVEDRITTFLTDHVGDGELLGPIAEDVEPVAVEPPTVEAMPVEPLPVEPPTVEPPAVTPGGVVVMAAVLPVGPPLPRRALKRLWNPSRNALHAARGSGFLSVFCLIGLLASGQLRKRLKQRFRRLHVTMALGLFLSLSMHGIIYIFEYGAPAVPWYWAGLIGFLLLIVTQVQGIVRKRFRRGLLIMHIAGAFSGLALGVVHWVLAWL